MYSRLAWARVATCRCIPIACTLTPSTSARACWSMLKRRPPRPNIDLALTDVEHLPWPSETFDTVVSTCVFCSVPDPLQGLREIRRVLRAAGWALFLEHMRPGAPWLAAVFDWLDPLVSRSGPHINRRTMETIRAAGFMVEREDNLVSDVLKLIVVRP